MGKNVVFINFEGAPTMYDPDTLEVYPEFYPAKNYPVVVQAYFEDTVVSHNGKVFIPVTWLIQKFPEQATNLRRIAAQVRRLYMEHIGEQGIKGEIESNDN